MSIDVAAARRGRSSQAAPLRAHRLRGFRLLGSAEHPIHGLSRASTASTASTAAANGTSQCRSYERSLAEATRVAGERIRRVDLQGRSPSTKLTCRWITQKL